MTLRADHLPRSHILVSRYICVQQASIRHDLNIFAHATVTELADIYKPKLWCGFADNRKLKSDLFIELEVVHGAH